MQTVQQRLRRPDYAQQRLQGQNRETQKATGMKQGQGMQPNESNPFYQVLCWQPAQRPVQPQLPQIRCTATTAHQPPKTVGTHSTTSSVCLMPQERETPKPKQRVYLPIIVQLARRQRTPCYIIHTRPSHATSVPPCKASARPARHSLRTHSVFQTSHQTPAHISQADSTAAPAALVAAAAAAAPPRRHAACARLQPPPAAAAAAQLRAGRLC